MIIKNILIVFFLALCLTTKGQFIINSEIGEDTISTLSDTFNINPPIPGKIYYVIEDNEHWYYSPDSTKYIVLSAGGGGGSQNLSSVLSQGSDAGGGL